MGPQLKTYLKNMTNLIRQFAIFTALFLLLSPVSAMAGRRYETPQRELRPEEKKVGSVYRGCIGFHCLEEEPEISMLLQRDENCEGGDVCVGVSTNARDGVVVLMRGNAGTEVCLTKVQNGFEDIAEKDACAAAHREPKVVAAAKDDLDGGLAAFTTGEVDEAEEYIHFIAVMSY